METLAKNTEIMTYEEVKRIRENPTAKYVDNKELSAMIDDAIEKQIPKKPKNFLRNMCTQEYLCPLCKIRIISKINGEFIAGGKDKYCSHCGQAIDWEDDYEIQ